MDPLLIDVSRKWQSGKVSDTDQQAGSEAQRSAPMTAASAPDTLPVLAVSPVTTHVRNRVQIPNIRRLSGPGTPRLSIGQPAPCIVSRLRQISHCGNNRPLASHVRADATHRGCFLTAAPYDAACMSHCGNPAQIPDIGDLRPLLAISVRSPPVQAGFLTTSAYAAPSGRRLLLLPMRTLITCDSAIAVHQPDSSKPRPDQG